MKASDVVAAALATQTKSGAFLSTVHIDGEPLPDENAFVTAIVVHELSRWAHDSSVRGGIERALDFLLRCELQDRPGHFCFYPDSGSPSWMPVRLPPDSDDTALCAVLLVRYGRRPDAFLRYVAGTVLDPFQLHYLSEASEPWHRVGVYLTWLRRAFPRNVVDCCVNINVLTLLSEAGLAHTPAFAAIVEMLEAGVDTVGPVTARARRLSPWYPHPRELVHAVERAVAAGVEAVAPALSKMRRLPWATSGGPASGTPVCGSLDGRVVWTCERLQELRAID